MAKFFLPTVVLLIVLFSNCIGYKAGDDTFKSIRMQSGHTKVSEKRPISDFKHYSKKPSYLVITTWDFPNATAAAYETLAKKNSSAIDAVVAGCSYCEQEQCDYTVGYGGSPDENGETTLDAMIYDGDKMDVGAVGGLKLIKNAIAVARAVLFHTQHSILVGDAATEFALKMGFKEEELSTNRSLKQWNDWKHNKCQPNFWKSVVPNPKLFCGPYRPIFDFNVYSNASTERVEVQPGNVRTHNELYKRNSFKTYKESEPYEKSGGKKRVQYTFMDKFHHDTIGQIVMDRSGTLVTGTSSNGAIHKIPGRVGDAAVPGAGGYADKRYGGAVATGDGDIMMRFSTAAAVVLRMQNHMSPARATMQVITLIKEKYPNFSGAVLAMNAAGDFGAACYGFDIFPFTVANSDVDDGRVRKFYINCLDQPSKKMRVL